MTELNLTSNVENTTVEKITVENFEFSEVSEFLTFESLDKIDGTLSMWIKSFLTKEKGKYFDIGVSRLGCLGDNKEDIHYKNFQLVKDYGIQYTPITEKVEKILNISDIVSLARLYRKNILEKNKMDNLLHRVDYTFGENVTSSDKALTKDDIKKMLTAVK